MKPIIYLDIDGIIVANENNLAIDATKLSYYIRSMHEF